MANSITKKTSNVVVWIILLLLIVSLGGFGVSNFGGQIAAIATVGNTKVDINDYNRALRQELGSYQAQLGHPLPLAQAISGRIDQAVRGQMITLAALEDEAVNIGLSVGDQRIRREVLANPAFLGPNGQFDRNSYTRTLINSGISEAEYEAKLRAETSRAILQSVILNGTAASSAMSNAYLDFIQQRRSFSWIRLDQSALNEQVPEPTNAQIKTYYDENANRFTVPEKKRLSYIQLIPDMIVDQIDVPESDLRKEYEKRGAQYSQPERRLVERLVYPDKEAADIAKGLLDSDMATFGDLVTNRGLTLLDVDLGDVTREQLGTAADAVFSMEALGVIGPLTTDFGPALFRVNGILAAQETPFENVRQELQDELAMDRARRQIAADITNIDDLLAGGATLQEVVDETDMTLGQIDWSLGDSESIARYSAFRTAATKIQKGDYAEVLELEDGGIFALEFVEPVPSFLKPLDNVMPDAITGWEAQEIETRLAEQANDMLKQLQDGADFTNLGQILNNRVGALRSENLEGLPSDFISEVFDMTQGDHKIIDGDGAVYLVQLDEIQAPDSTNSDLAQIKLGLEAEISQALAQDIFIAFSTALQTRLGVQVNAAAVNAVHSQFQQ